MNDEEFLCHILHNMEEEEAIVLIYKDGSKWYEKHLCGQKPYGFHGKTYMSYLEPKNILSWLRKDYNDATILTEEWLENNDLEINYGHLDGFYDVDWSHYGVEIDG